MKCPHCKKAIENFSLVETHSKIKASAVAVLAHCCPLCDKIIGVDTHPQLLIKKISEAVK